LDGDGEWRNLRVPVFWLEMERELESIGNPVFQNDGIQPWGHQQLRKTPTIQRKSSGCVQVVLLLPVFAPLLLNYSP